MYDVSVTYHCFYYLYCFIHCDTLYFLTTQSCDCIIFYIHIKDKYISILETHITQFTLLILIYGFRTVMQSTHS